MAFVLKFAKTIRNNWKKSVFFTGIASYGIYYGHGVYQDSLIRRAYCEEVRVYGDQPLKLGERARKVTVFLNPAARKGKAKKLFDKNVAPILHLAGIEVTVVRTEYEGQAKKYMEVLDDTDAIVVAGGDGTLSEVVTGLLRRKDEESFSRVPIGIIPLGYTNTMASLIHKKDKSDAKWLLDAAMSVVKGVAHSIDVMKIIDAEQRTVFAVNNLEWGAFEEAKLRAKKYWYFGPLKHRWTYLMSAVGNWPPVIQGQLSYIHPCVGCSSCFKLPAKPQWKWWHLFLPPKITVPEKDYSSIQNDECGVRNSEYMSNLELSASVNQSTQSAPKQDERGLHFTLGPSSMEKMEFIKEGWRRIRGTQSENLKQTQQVQEFTLIPEGDQSHKSYSIDNEQYEIMPITVHLLRNKLHILSLPTS